MNIQIETLRKELATSIANANLPIGVTFLVVKDLVNEIAVLYDQAIYNEQQKANSTSVEKVEAEEV